MNLSDFHPKPSLVTPRTKVETPRFPVIDVHNPLEPRLERVTALEDVR